MRRVTAARLQDLAARLLADSGVDAGDAAAVAGALIDSDLRGHFSHGAFLALTYCEEIAAGTIDPSGRARVAERRGATARIDGGGGLGQLAARLAMRTAVELARTHGIGAASVTNSGHFGAGAHWVEMAADAGMAGFATSTEPAGWVAPAGALEPALANLPWAWAFPGPDGEHLVLDMATGTIADGKLKLARIGIGQLPPGAATDGDGRATVDPARARLIQPLAGAKGLALTLACDALAGILGGLGGTTARGRDPAGGSGSTGQFHLAVDVAAFGDPARFRANLKAQLDALVLTRTARSAHPVRIPGERGRTRRRRQRREGISLPEPIWRRLNEAAGTRR